MSRRPAYFPTQPQPQPQPHERMLVFALREGQIWHVKNVPAGKACGCICPACGESLIAVNQGMKKAAHFRHEARSDCASGYETALHLAGKEALLRLKRISLPIFRKQLKTQACDGRIFSGEVVLDQALDVKADRAWEEVWMNGFRPDVVFEAGGHRLLIEVRVTHAADDKKLAKLAAIDVSAIEIDLSRLNPEVLRDRETFDAYVVSDPQNRRWLYSRKLKRQEAAVLAKLQQQVDAYEPEGRRRLAAERAKAKREQVSRRKRSLQAYAERAALRERLAPLLRQLELSRDEQAIAKREQRLMLRNPVPSLLHYRRAGIPSLFVRCKWHWVFNATFEQWQAYVLDLLFPGALAGPRAMKTDIIVKALVEKFQIPQFVRGIMYSKSKFLGPALLTPAEEEWLPSPRQAVLEYLEHLCSMRVLKKIFASRRRCIGFQGLGGSVQACWLQQANADAKDSGNPVVAHN